MLLGGIKFTNSSVILAALVVTSVAFLCVIIGLAVILASCNRQAQAESDKSKNGTCITPTSGTPPAGENTDRSRPFPDSPYGKYRHTAVTSDSRVCSSIGTDMILLKNGSVVDSAIATMLCIGVVSMQSSGVGGGHFSTIYASQRDRNEKRMITIAARERAPASAKADMYVNGTASSVTGGKAIGIPGEILGFHEAWKQFGRLPWSDLFQPAIRLCVEGFTIEKSLANAMNQSRDFIEKDPAWRELFAKADGTTRREGDTVYNLKLAETLRRIAADPNAFYNGSLADDIVQDIADYGGNITLADLRGYQVSEKLPLNVTLQNGIYTLYNPPPPSSGVILDFIMKVLDGFNFTEQNMTSASQMVLTHHVIAETFKQAYARRTELGDEQFVNIAELVANLTSEEYAASVRRKVHLKHTHETDWYRPKFYNTADSGTSHMNILAADGSAVAMTSTINYLFGAKVRGRRTGIIFNNEMDDFSTPGLVNLFGFSPSPSNFIVPGKMPVSSMCPTIVLDRRGNVAFMGGGSGGSRITTTTSFVMMNSLWFNKDLKSATDSARIHHQLVPETLYYEPWLDNAVLDGLRNKRHNTTSSDKIANVNSIRRRCSSISGSSSNSSNSLSGGTTFQPPSSSYPCIEAVSDGRKGGVPDGI